MPQSLTRNLLHLIFSTKDRWPFLHAGIRPTLHGYLAGILKNVHSPAIIIGSVADHVHVLFVLSKTHALSQVVEEVKRTSSKWMKTQGSEFASFYWQNGYGAFSVSPSLLDKVREYIAGQEEHHRKQTFQDEFREFCQRHGVELDERYVWD